MRAEIMASLSGHPTARSWLLFLTAVTIHSLVSTKMTRCRLSILRRQLRATRTHAGRRTENELCLCDDREAAALPNQFSNNARRLGLSGQLTLQRAKDSNSGKVRLRYAALHQT